MKIAIAQINPTVGDFSYNTRLILDFTTRGASLGADLVVCPELSLLGYPPKDLLLREDFLEAQHKYLDEIAQKTKCAVIVGAAIPRDKHCLPFNAAVLCEGGIWNVVGTKTLLPNYNVFDEKRYFSTKNIKACEIITYKGQKLLISICEDAWNCIPTDGQKYDFDPIDNALKEHGDVDVIVNISASPFTARKPEIRERIFTHIAKTYKTPVLLAGQVGANDQWLFDGQSLIVDQNGEIVGRGRASVEDMLVFDTKNVAYHRREETLLDKNQMILEVLTMGVRDYFSKTKTPGAIISLSGGIDSAVCASVAARALGDKRVRLVYLPSKYSSDESLKDAQILADNLSITLEVLAIENCVQMARNLVAHELDHCPHKNRDLADQNIQSRVRCLVIMALANTSDYLMLGTSNKSELSVGYCTIYGDMSGAFSIIGDLYKTQVQELAMTINQERKTIPEEIIRRPPTAELRENQLDTDSLPEYSVLDKILINFIDLEKSASEIARITGIEKTLIDRVISMVSQSEYKRRQAPFPLMVSDKVFGDARRLPIAKRVLNL